MSTHNMLEPIPATIFPDCSSVVITPVDDPLVCITDIYRDIMVFQPKYFEQGISGATKKVYVRKTVADMLLAAANSLPDGYKLKIFDAWRPFAVQKALYDQYYLHLSQTYGDQQISQAELRRQTSQFVSYPSEDPLCPFVHSTGGAVDLTLVDASGKDMNMGTEFDDFSDVAHTAYFESTDSYEIRDNRRLLYNAMICAGFTNYPAEWWHYDFGDRFWAAMKNQESIYTGIYTEPA